MHRAYQIMSGVGIVAIVASGVFLIAALLIPSERMTLSWVAWSSFLAVVVSMESRVRMGYRLARGPLFMTHMLTAIPGLLLLSAYLFYPSLSFTLPLAAVLLLGGLTSGSVLFHQGWQRHGSTSASPDSIV